MIATRILKQMIIGSSSGGNDFAFGLDALKDSVPDVTQVYFSFDTNKLYYCEVAGTWIEYDEQIERKSMAFQDGIDLSGSSPASSPIDLSNLILASNCNVIRGAGIIPTRVSGWTSFSGVVTDAPAQVYSDYRNLSTAGLAEVLGIGSFPMMLSGASCASMIALQAICQVDAGSTILTANGAPAIGVFPIFAKLALNGETFNPGGVAAAIFASVQANVTDVSLENVSVFNIENASGSIKDIFYFKATSGGWTNLLTLAGTPAPFHASGCTVTAGDSPYLQVTVNDVVYGIALKTI